MALISLHDFHPVAPVRAWIGSALTVLFSRAGSDRDSLNQETKKPLVPDFEHRARHASHRVMSGAGRPMM